MARSVAAPSSSSDLETYEGTAGRLAGTSAVAGYALSLALVAAAAIAAFVVDHLVETPNLSLVFVLPVIIAALSFGWGPALAAALLGVAAFDFLFVEPRMSFRVASPTDLWALGLLLLVAAIASTVGAQSRRRAVEARRAAEQAEALRALAHSVIKADPGSDVVHVAANSLGRIFDAPAVILAERAGKLWIAAASRGSNLSAADEEAAQWALAKSQPTRADAYPFDQAEFDFWPVPTRRLVLGVKFPARADGRPEAPDRLVDLVAGYLAAASDRARAPR